MQDLYTDTLYLLQYLSSLFFTFGNQLLFQFPTIPIILYNSTQYIYVCNERNKQGYRDKCRDNYSYPN